MEPNENMEIQEESFEPEDLLVEDISEEPQDDSINLEEQPADQPEEQPQSAGGQKEPGYVKRRISEATQPLYEQIEALKAQLEPLRQYQMDAEANELVRTGKVKDLETARELVRYRQGQPQTQQAESQPRNEKGQFTSQQEEQVSPATQARIDMLQHQADKIKSKGGPDVIAEFRNNPYVRNKIVSGELDFYDVAEQMQSGKKKVSSPMRSPNGASGVQKTAIEAMTDEQFDKLVKKIQGGARYTMK